MDRSRPRGKAGRQAPAGRQPRGRGRAAAQSAPPAPDPATEVAGTAPTLSALLTAAGPQHSPEARVAALRRLQQALITHAGQQVAVRQLASVWPQVVRLLWDGQPKVSAAAVPLVVMLGKQAAHAGSGGQGGWGLVFDWLLPVLSRRATPEGAALAPHQTSAALLAIRDCLAASDGVTLSRYANAVLEACQGLLEATEDAAGAVSILPALLDALAQAARHPHSLRPRFQDLVDLLLGWALEPALPARVRVSMSRTFDAFRPAWVESIAFRSGLLASLLKDAERFATGEGGSSGMARLLGSAACLVPMLQAVPAAEEPSQTAAAVRRLLGCFSTALTAYAGPGAPKLDLVAASVETFGHLHSLSKLAAWLATPRQPSSPQQRAAPTTPRRILQRSQAPGAGSEAAAPASDYASLQLVVTEEAPRDILSEFKSMALFSAAPQPTPQPAHVVVHLEVHHGQPAAPSDPTSVDLLDLYDRAASIAFTALASPAISAAPRAVAAALAALSSWARSLQQQGPPLAEHLAALCAPEADYGGALAGLMSYDDEGVLRQLARVYLQCLKSGAGLEGLLQQLSTATQQLDGCKDPEGSQEAAAGRLEFILGILPHAEASPEAALGIWEVVLPLSPPHGPLSKDPDLSLAASKLLQAVAPGAMERGDRAAMLAAVLRLQAGIGAESSSSSALGPLRLHSLEWMEQTAVLAITDGHAQQPDVASALAEAAKVAVAEACARSPQHREAALAGLHSMVAASAKGGSGGGLLQSPGFLTAICWLAIERSSDASPAAAEHAKGVLAVLAPHLAAAGGCDAMPTAATHGATQYAAALQPQQRAFKALQLTRLFEYLSKPIASGTADSDVSRPLGWLTRLAQSLAALPPGAVKDTGYQGSTVNPEAITTSPELAWYVVQELAKHCVAICLKTPLGGAAETFGVLEQALQQLPLELAAAGPQRAEALQRAWLLLDFMHALEQGVFNAHQGSALRPPPPRSAMAFFSANQRVCQGWFSRIRPMALRAAISAQHQQHTLHHGLRRLVQLEEQIAAVLVTRPEEQQLDILGDVRAPDSAIQPSPATEVAKKLLQRQEPSSAGMGVTMSPTAALLAAATGGKVVSKKQQPAASPAASRADAFRKSLKVLASRVFEAVGEMAKALCSLKDTEGLAELRAYCQQAFSPLLEQLWDPASSKKGEAASGADGVDAAASEAAAVRGLKNAWAWLHAVELHASGRYEEAIRQYASLPGVSRAIMGAELLAELAAEAYASVDDWQGLRSWMQGPGANLQKGLTSCYQAMAAWGTADFAAAQQHLESSEWLKEGHLLAAGLDRRSTAATEGRLLQALLTRDGERAAELQAASAAILQTISLTAVGLDALMASEALCQLGRLQLLSQGGGAPYLGGLRLSSQAPNVEDLSPWTAAGDQELGGHDLRPLMQLLRIVKGAGDPDPSALLQYSLAAANGARMRSNPKAAGRLLSQATSLARGGHGSKTDLLELRLLSGLTEQSDACTLAQKLWLIAEDARGCGSGSISRRAAEQLLALDGASIAGVIAASDLRSALSSSPPPALELAGTWPATSRLEQVLLSGGEGAPAAVQLGMLRSALVAGPSSSQSWWQLAKWVDDRTSHHKGEISAEVEIEGCTAAFLSYCQALALSSLPKEALSEECTLLPVLLRLLGLVASQGSRLPEAVVRGGLGLVPPQLWLPVLPQLLGQLASSSCHVAARQAFVGLLTSLSEVSPASAMLPVLAELRDPSPGIGDSPARSALEALAESCQARHPELVRDTWTLMEELARLAVLWEEHWQALLLEVYSAVSKATGALQSELQALPAEQQAAALADRYIAELAPAMLSFTAQLDATEGSPPETLHEGRVRRALLPRLQWLRDQLLSPAASLADLHRPLQCIKQVVSEFNYVLRRRHLRTADVSPGLARLACLAVPVPGAACAGLTVAGLSASVRVLHTKTRPKRLALLGSDGKEYTFLLKGREDLRVDQRLMQVFSAASAALRGSGCADLRLHGFAVVPIARRVGLLQWVEGSVPLYELYTAWQARRAERAAVVQAAQHPGGVPKAAPKPPRALAQFYALVKEAGIDQSLPRSEWPADALASIFQELCRSVPRSLIADELWAGASSAGHWWRRQAAYRRSTAVSSVVGHLLGLGDRHLDNILLHRRHGHVAHVDFNVVFDRGAQLKVPEVVPFRLTQTLAAALGPAGAEGAFRLSCQQTLRALRANGDALEALLGAVAEDPLVEWELEAADAARRKALELAVTLELFCSACESSAPELQAAAAAAGQALSRVTSALSAYVQLFRDTAAAAAMAAEHHTTLQQCRSTLERAALVEQQLQARVERGQLTAQAALSEAQKVGEEAYRCLQECTAWRQQYQALITGLVSSPLPALTAAADGWDPRAASIPLGLVMEFSPSGGTLVQAALRVKPGDVPVAPSLLLAASSADSRGLKLLTERADALRDVGAAVQEYTAALAHLLGPQSAELTLHAKWLPPMQAAVALPAPQGFAKALELSPKAPGSGALVGSWRALRAAADASGALLRRLQSTQDGLLGERADLAALASAAKARMLEAAGITGGADVAEAFAAFSEQQAKDVGALGAASGSEGSVLLEGLQRVVLGYTSTAVALRGLLPSDGLFTASGGAARLEWLTGMVDCTDSLSGASAQLQLAAPALAGLLQSDLARGRISAAAAALRGALPEVLARIAGAPSAAAVAQGLTQALSPLLAVAGEVAPLAALLRSLQGLQHAAGQLQAVQSAPAVVVFAADGGAEGGSLQARLSAALQRSPLPPTLAQQLQLAVLAVEGWEALEAAAARCSPGGGQAAGEAAWEVCSAALAATVAGLVRAQVLPRLEAALVATARGLRADAPALRAQPAVSRGGQPSARQEAAGPEAPQAGLELSPFEFDVLLPSDLLSEALELPGGAASGEPGPGLVPFTDFGDAPGGELEELEAAGAPSLAAAEGGTAPQLPRLLGDSAVAAGTLAAIDSVQHVAKLSHEQATWQAQRAQRDLAAFTWLHEPQLLQALSAGALGPAPAVVGAAAGGSVPAGLHPLVAGWGVESHRHAVLARLQAAVNTLLSLEGPLQQWQEQWAGVEAQWEGALEPVMTYAPGYLQAQLAPQQRWLAGAAARGRSLVGLAQAILQFEASRSVPAAAEGGASSGPAQPALAEAGATWQCYASLLQRLAQLSAACGAADAELAASSHELAALREGRAEAVGLMQSAEASGSEAAALFSANALPLVKATQALGGTLQRLQPALALCAAPRASLQRAASALGLLGRGVQAAEALQGLRGEAGAGAARLEAALASLDALPAAVRLAEEGLAVAARAQRGGRGELAARQQAAGTIDALSAPLLNLEQQMAAVPAAVAALEAAHPTLQGLAARAAEHERQLREQHGLDLGGLPALLAASAALAMPTAALRPPQPQASAPGELPLGVSPGATQAKPAYDESSGEEEGELEEELGGGDALAPEPAGGAAGQSPWQRGPGQARGPPALGAGLHGASRSTGAQRRAFAASALARFRAKLRGQGEDGAAVGVEQAVEQLIEQATSAGNLARMWEGWQAWV